MNQTNIKYTTDGRKVVVIGNLNAQEKIVQEIFVIDGSEIPQGEHFVVKSLLDAPTISWKEKHVKDMEAAYEQAEKRNTGQRNLLYQKQKELKAHLDYAGKALKGISPSSFDTLIMVLTGKVKWVVLVGGYYSDIREWTHGTSDSCNGDMMRLISLFGKDDGTLSFRKSQYYDGSDSKSGDEFIPFETYEEAKAKWIELYSTTINETTIKVAAAHGIELDKEAMAKWAASRKESILKEIQRLAGIITVHEAQVADLDAGLPKSKATQAVKSQRKNTKRK